MDTSGQTKILDFASMARNACAAMKTTNSPRRRRPVYFTPRGQYARRVTHYAAAQRRTPGELSQRWAEDRIDMLDFPCLEFRETAGGSFAVVRGTRLAVWQVVQLARVLGWGRALCEHLEVIPEVVDSAQGYYQRHADEVDSLIESAEAVTFDSLKARFPKLRRLDEIPT